MTSGDPHDMEHGMRKTMAADGSVVGRTSEDDTRTEGPVAEKHSLASGVETLGEEEKMTPSRMATGQGRTMPRIVLLGLVGLALVGLQTI